MNFRTFFDELEKLGAISAEEARRSLDNLDSIENQKPSKKKMLEYGALGAASGPVISAAKDFAGGKAVFEAAKHPVTGTALPFGRLRAAGGAAIGGALASGAVPLIRYHMDKAREKGNLRRFMDEYEQEKTAPKVAEVAEAKKEKTSLFSESQYSGGTGGGGFVYTSGLPSFTAPGLESTVQQKKAGAMTPIGLSPASRLASSQRIGMPKITSPSGPSIANIAKPKGPGTGRAMPGTTNKGF